MCVSLELAQAILIIYQRAHDVLYACRYLQSGAKSCQIVTPLSLGVPVDMPNISEFAMIWTSLLLIIAGEG